MKQFAVLLAGLDEALSWPLNQFEEPVQPHNEYAVNRTLKRNLPLFSPEDCYVLLSQENLNGIENKLMAEFPKSNFICEPVLRGTAAGIFYAALKLHKKFGNSVMAVLPTDHYIDNEPKYLSVMAEALKTAQESDKIVTIGIKPAFPAGNYGYLNFKKNFTYRAQHIFQVIEFIEKPGRSAAQHYLNNDEYVWNSGIYLFKTSVIIDAVKQFMPLLYAQLMQGEDAIGTQEEERVIGGLYPQIRHQSIDYGVMERSDEVVLLLGDFGWSDIGPISSVLGESSKNTVLHNCRNVTVLGENKLLIAIGCSDLFIADTGEALLVCHKDGFGELNNLEEMIRGNGRGIPITPKETE